MRRIVCIMFCAVVVMVDARLPLSHADEPLPAELVARTEARSPADERAGFHLPPGFEIQLVASDPDIHKPMNIAFDDRGRLWVTETIEYPYPAKDGTTPRDTVKILEDFAPDGKARKITTFAEGLNIPIGLLPMPGGNSALVHAIPTIDRHTDTNGDGVADTRELTYKTYGSRDTHGMTNAFTWGLDGWIYACHGFNNESEVKGKDGKPLIMQSGNTYRMKADGTHEDTIEQMDRLFRERLYNGNPQPDSAGRIRVDDWEMEEKVQALVGERWDKVNTENFAELGDFAGYQSSFLRLFGFGLTGVDYSVETDPGIGIPSIPPEA